MSQSLLPVNQQKAISQTVNTALGSILNERELNSCINKMQILELPAGKHFWQPLDSPTGIYIVLTGKVRILDSSDRWQSLWKLVSLLGR